MSSRDFVLGVLLAVSIGVTLTLLVVESWVKGW